MTNAPKRSDITLLCAPEAVSMGDEWFDIARPTHFWFARRFAVLNRLAGGDLQRASEVAEIGCGNGVLQRQVEEHFGRGVDGFDLSIVALQANISRQSRLYCANVEKMPDEFVSRYQLILLFDVIEHVPDPVSFLKLVVRLIKPGGKLVINVPALPKLYSSYDKSVGHLRRYASRELIRTVRASGVAVNRWTYWGLPLVPALWVRMLRSAGEGTKTIKRDMEVRSGLSNAFFGSLCSLEPIPQHLLGASLMLVADKQAN
jgi:SAM-dependent methyltransferase